MSVPLRICPACKRRTRRSPCQHCHARLPEVVVAEGASTASGHYLVTSAAQAFALEQGKPFLVGRNAQANLVAHSTDVSRQHAQLIWGREGAVLLQDLDARHGTFVNGERLKPHAVRPLAHGDRIRLASNTVCFYFAVSAAKLEETIGQHGVGTLTSEYAVKDIRKRSETRRAKRSALKETAAQGPAPLPKRGDLQATPGAQLLAMLRAREFTGRVEFFDGVQRGHVELLNGKPSRGVMPRVSSAEALADFNRLRRGSYQLVEEFPHTGSFSLISASDLLVELYDQQATGILSLYREDSPESLTGRLVIKDGVCLSAGFGRKVSAEALEHVGTLTEGRFAFEPKPTEEVDGRLSTPRGKRETIRFDP